VQLYEAFGLAIVALACRHALTRVENGYLERGAAFRLYMALYGALRFALDPLRVDGRPERFLGLSHQQGLALFAIAVAIVWHGLAVSARRGRPVGPAAGISGDPSPARTRLRRHA
jgi:prolipoprotein diacylglyceryltransferase